MRKLVVTTALALVLAGSAYAQGHHGGGGGGGIGGGGGGGAAAHVGGGGGPGFSGGAAVNGGGHFSGGGGGPSMMSRGPSGPSGFSSSYNGRSGVTTRGSQFSRTNEGPQGRTLYNQERGNHAYNSYGNREHGMNGQGNHLYNSYGNREHGMNGPNEHGNHGIHVGRANINEFRHGINHDNFFVHGRHFGFRRFWNGQWVFLTGWDACTAWAWVAVAPGVFAWAPIDVCIG